jgi:hypothetical protein
VITHFSISFQPFMASTNALGWNHVAGGSASPTLLLCTHHCQLSRTLPFNIVLDCFHAVWNQTSCQSFNAFYAFK